jgi:hypothetical protein
MSEPEQIQKVKFSSLIHAFEDFGYKSSTRVGQNEFRLFLNKKSSSGFFDNLLCDKLFEIISLDNKSTLSIQEFVEGFLIFEEQVARNAESFRIKFLKEQEIYNKILKQFELYRAQNLNAEGFCKNAKISGEITDIDIKKKLDGLKEIIILVIFNDKKEELHFKIGGEATNIKKSFEFRPSSRKDHFEFVMKGLNEKNVEFDIGSKIFPLDDITSQEEYFVQIVVPEIDNKEQVAAFINATILLYMSDYKYYESMLRKQAKRMNKYKNAANKAAEYLRYVREIYGDLTQIKPDLIVDFNNEKLMQRRGAKLNVNFNNEMEAQIPGGNFYVEFNNEREIKKKSAPLKVEFNNSKEVITPVIETKKVEYSYKTSNYTSSVEKSMVNKTEQNTQLIKNENIGDININTGSNILSSSIQQVPEQLPEKIEKKEEDLEHIKLYSDVVDSDESQQVNQEMIQVDSNNLQEQNQQSQQIYTNEQIISQQNQYNQQYVESQNDLEKVFLQQQNTQITTEQNGGEFDIDAYLKQQGYDTNVQIQNNKTEEDTDYLAAFKAQHGSQTQQIDLQGFNLENYGNMAKTTTNTTTTIQQEQNMNALNTGINQSGMVQEYHLETKTLEPIINKENINYSVNKAILNETTNKVVVSENVLPVSYLPEKVNKLIVSDQVTTLPLIRAGSKVTYNTLEPIIHESKVYIKDGSENITNNYDNLNINGNTTADANFDYNNLIANNGETTQNGLVEGNNYDYNYNFSTTENQNGNNWTSSAQSSYSTTNIVQTTSQYNPEINYQMETQGFPVEHGEQIQYGN